MVLVMNVKLHILYVLLILFCRNLPSQQYSWLKLGSGRKT